MGVTADIETHPTVDSILSAMHMSMGALQGSRLKRNIIASPLRQL